jgi:pimeloyl-ACP methyl ester carboxylesterase
VTRVLANGLHFHVNRLRSGEAGDRPVVVCVHGLAVVDSAATSFLLGFDLARDADVVVYDLRGHGRSDVVPSGYRVTDHAGDLVALLDALALDRPVHLVGFSYGAAIAVVATMRAPTRVASLCLLDGVVPLRGWNRSLGAVEELQDWVDRARAVGAGEDQIVAAIIDRMVTEHGVAPRRAASLTRRVHRLLETTTLGADIRDEPEFDEPGDYRAITCPVLGVYGDRSDLYWQTDVLPALIPGITVHTLAGADHLDVYWRIDEIRPLVRQFIGLPAPNGAPA